MKRVAIIDPSVSGKGGHYLEYALRVAKQVNEAGLNPVLGAHVDFRNDGSFPGAAYGVFHKTFWEQSERSAGVSMRLRTVYANIKRAFRSVLRPIFRALLIWYHYSWINLASARAHDLESLFDPKLSIYSSNWMGVKTSASLVRLLYIFQAVKRALRPRSRGRLTAFIRKLKRLVRAILILTVVVAAVVLSPLIIFFFIGRTLAGKLIATTGSVSEMARDVERFIHVSKLEAGDIVFVPTVGIPEILAIAAVLKKVALTRKLKWRLLMRRDAFFGHQPGWGLQGGQLQILRLKGVFHYAAQAMKTLDIGWYTDTLQLAAQYNRISDLKFEVFPVPTGNGPIRSQAGTYVVHGYVGDARTEKGFQFLSDIWDRFRLWSGFGDGDRLLVQSNFNIKGGEPEAVKGMFALRGQSPGEVEFVPGPLASEEYDRVLSSCGIILLPYDSSAYASRSSGIFAEAVRKQIPAVVTSASWGAKVVEPMRQCWLKHVDTAFAVVCQLSSPDALEIRGHSWGTVKDCDPTFDTAIFSLEFLTALAGGGVIVELHLRNKEGDDLGRLSDVVMITSSNVKLGFTFPVSVAEFDIWVKPLNKEANILPRHISLNLGRLQAGITCGFAVRTSSTEPESFAAALLDIRKNLDTYNRQLVVLSRILAPAIDDQAMMECLVQGAGVDFDSLYANAEHEVSLCFAEKLPLRRVQKATRARWSGR
ncbi:MULTISPECIES: hypothetical protein [Asticcacaulis]|uniref:hypothetical protein n=1 Tax=Asticcacaulis TaxID=76890 RepID=UPI001AE4BBEC|nr:MULTISPECIES: hypothetical protein [Asticcacaulis]MBP2161883.1 hypothetical protein [Asticcacaulis solisilvae]MDR6802930.1 hypothetical protein [Asticcacaulis sp. BE141]